MRETDRPGPTLRTLGDLVKRVRTAHPATPALEVPRGPLLTYGDLDGGSARVAHALTRRGVRPGDRVAVQVAKSHQAVLLYLACVRTGAVLVPLNPAYTDAEVARLLDDAEPALVIRDPARTAPVAAAPVITADDRGAGTLADLAVGLPGTFEDAPLRPEDPAAVLYTSGTTGRPKGAVLSHGNLAANAVALHRAWGFGPGDTLLHALPVFHLHGLFVAINCVLLNRTGMVFLPRFDVDEVIVNLPRCTVFMGVPTFYARLLADPRLDPACCRAVRLFVSGSAPLGARAHGEFRSRTGHDILERYGMTETSIITSNPLDGERRPGTVGLPLPGVTVRVVDPTRGTSPLPPGVPGEIEVSGPSVFPGYWRDPERTASEFTADGFFRTGDIGELDADGYLRIVGRSRDLIISGGLNVYPGEVEDVIDHLDGVLECAVIGLPDPDLGEAVVAVVVTRPGSQVDEAVIRAGVRGRLAGFKVPKRVEMVDALPRNDMGKVRKEALRAALADRTGDDRPG
jgi:malonyl-CoA/methylmalonyl-CoA synthetase